MLSAMPSMALRRRCRLTRKASAGTPTTARTCGRFLPFCLSHARPMRWRSISCTASSSCSEPSLISPRSSGRRRSSIERFSSASRPTSTGFLHDLARHHVDGPADVAVDDVTLAVRGRDRAAGGAEVDAHATASSCLPCLIAFLGDAIEVVGVGPDSVAAAPRRSARDSRRSSSSSASSSFDRHDTSARIAGISVPTSTTNGAVFTPRFCEPRVDRAATRETARR